MKKQYLAIEFDFDFLLIGICCGEKDYRLCYEINKSLGIKLKRVTDIKIQSKEKNKHTLNTLIEIPEMGKKNVFSLFEHKHPKTGLKYNVISNKSQGTRLISEKKEVDYFLMINGEAHTKEKKEALAKVKSIVMVLTAFEVNPQKLKSKDRLILND